MSRDWLKLGSGTAMRTALVVTTTLIAVTSVSAGDIREFSIQRLERLGNEISRRDALAARAADLVAAQHPEFKKTSRGWITALGSTNRVHMIMQKDSGVTAGYLVTFPASGAPQIEDLRGQDLPTAITLRYRARETAIAALKGKLYDLAYNFEVLDDPDGSGFLVYALGASARPGDAVLAGHFRVTVSALATKAERVDPLSRSVLIVNRADVPAGSKPVGSYMAQLVSDKPVETLIYTSNLQRSPIYVATPPNGQVWIVERGKMRREGRTAFV